MSYTQESIQEELLRIINKENGLNEIHSYMDGHAYQKKILAESLLKKTPVAKNDEFNKHVLIARFFKNSGIPQVIPIKEQLRMDEEGIPYESTYIPLRKFSKSEAVELVEVISKNIEQEATIYLEMLFDDGQEYSFNHSDGLIDSNITFKEEEDFYDVYAYYAYFGK